MFSDALRVGRAAGLAGCVMLAAGMAWATPTERSSGPDASLTAVPRTMDPNVRRQGEKMVERAIAYLRSQQDAATGGWSVAKEGPSFPAISSLVLHGMLLQPGLDATDPAIARGVGFVLSKRQPDGGIYDQLLPSYNTAISLSMLTRVSTPEAKAAIGPAQQFLRRLQYGEDAVVFDSHKESAEPVGKEHPFYGGIGYGRHGRPDLSNLQWVLQALHDSGVPGDDAAFQRALVFLQRTQMVEEFNGMKINDMPYAKGSSQGGFIYATAVNSQTVGQGQSQATEPVEETLSDGTKVSRLRAYGSMTYAGFKSYIHADLKKDDPRVLAALQWICENYTLSENPGIGTDGYYYYLVTFSRALAAFGQQRLNVVTEAGKREDVNWRDDLVRELAKLQQSDGSFRSVDDRWMENNSVLITAYSLLALQEALRSS